MGLPREWTHAVIIPGVKPGKVPDNPSSYRPIALASVLCKIMERMIMDTLVEKLERSDYFVLYQSGFLQGRSAVDAAFSSGIDIKKAVANKD